MALVNPSDKPEILINENNLGDPISIYGYVTHIEDGIKIADSEVQIRTSWSGDLLGSTITDSNGYYEIEYVCTSPNTLYVYADGYNTGFYNLPMPPASRILVNIALKRTDEKIILEPLDGEVVRGNLNIKIKTYSGSIDKIDLYIYYDTFSYDLITYEDITEEIITYESEEPYFGKQSIVVLLFDDDVKNYHSEKTVFLRSKAKAKPTTPMLNSVLSKFFNSHTNLFPFLKL